MAESGTYTYDAFISYRHKELDSAVAIAIHKQLETYHIPAYIQKATGKKRMGKVFRDQDELPLLADLGEGIQRALEQSEWLIVVCSPDLLLSKWCMAEIDTFIELGRRDRILTVLCDGEPEDSFPEQLRFVDLDGELVEREPLAADVRAEDRAATLKKVRREKLRLLAPMLGVGYDDLRRRHRERVMRVALASSLSAALFFAAFGGFALHQSTTIARQNQALEEQRSKIYASYSQEQLERGNRAGAALLALEALPEDMDTITPAASSALYDVAFRSYEAVWPIMQVSGSSNVVLAPDGKTFVAQDGDYARVYDIETLRLIYEHPGASTTIHAFESGDISGAQVKGAVYHHTGDTVFLSNGMPVFVNVRTGQIEKEGYFTDADELEAFGLSRYECVLPQSETRTVMDLGSGETLFAAPTKNGTSKNLFSPDGKYYIVATYTGLGVFDIAQREVVNILPCDGVMVQKGYTFFSPDSRFLVLTREYYEPLMLGDNETPQRFYTLQVLEIPSCRIVYENTFAGYPNLDGTVASQALPNYYHLYDSDIAEHLFSPDGSKLLLPVDTSKYGVFDLAREEMLFTQFAAIRFASFSPSGRQLMTINQRGNGWNILDAQSGENISRFYTSSSEMFLHGFILPDEDAVLIGGNDFGGLYRLRTDADEEGMELYFSDESGRRVRFASGGAPAAVVDDRSGTVRELADSTGYAEEGVYSSKGRFLATGDVVVGLSPDGVGSVLTSWDANTGEVLVPAFSVAGYFWTPFPAAPSLFLSPDGERMAVIYHRPEVMAGGFQVFDTRTGELLAENDSLVLSDVTVLLDRDVTKVLYIYDNRVTVFDAHTGDRLFALDDYPTGQLAIGIWSGHRAAISDNGRLTAVSHSKKGTLEIIDTTAGDRLYEIALGEKATTNPCFSHDGAKVAIGAGKYLFLVDTATGEVLYSLYDEGGFESDYRFSEDDQYLVGPDIRDAETGEVVCSVSLTAQPEWEVAETPGIKIPVGSAHAIYLPTQQEAVEALEEHIYEYAFTTQDKLRFALD